MWPNLLLHRGVIASSISTPPRDTTEDIALDKLPVGDGKGVLTSCLKYFYRAIPYQVIIEKI